jgi:hypothetical protein
LKNSLELTRACEVQPRSRGFPAGLLDQPFYGWVRQRLTKPKPASAGFHLDASPSQALKRAGLNKARAYPALKALV